MAIKFYYFKRYILKGYKISPTRHTRARTSVSASLEVGAQVLSDGGRLGALHRLVIDPDQDSHASLHDVDSALALLPTNNIISATEVEVLLASHVDTSASERHLVIIVVHHILHLVRSNLKVVRLGPDAPVQARNSSRFKLLLDHLGVDVVLPRHLDKGRDYTRYAKWMLMC